MFPASVPSSRQRTLKHNMDVKALQVTAQTHRRCNQEVQTCQYLLLKVPLMLLLMAAAADGQSFRLGSCLRPSVQEDFNVTKVKHPVILAVIVDDE